MQPITIYFILFIIIVTGMSNNGTSHAFADSKWFAMLLINGYSVSINKCKPMLKNIE